MLPAQSRNRISMLKVSSTFWSGLRKWRCLMWGSAASVGNNIEQQGSKPWVIKSQFGYWESKWASSPTSSGHSSSLVVSTDCLSLLPWSISPYSLYIPSTRVAIAELKFHLLDLQSLQKGFLLLSPFFLSQAPVTSALWPLSSVAVRILISLS